MLLEWTTMTTHYINNMLSFRIAQNSSIKQQCTSTPIKFAAKTNNVKAIQYRARNQCHYCDVVLRQTTRSLNVVST